MRHLAIALPILAGFLFVGCRLRTAESVALADEAQGDIQMELLSCTFPDSAQGRLAGKEIILFAASTAMGASEFAVTVVAPSLSQDMRTLTAGSGKIEDEVVSATWAGGMSLTVDVSGQGAAGEFKAHAASEPIHLASCRVF